MIALSQSKTNSAPPQNGEDGSIEGFSRFYLSQNGVNPDSFIWVMKLDSVILVAGKALKSGHVAQLPDGRVCVFRYAEKDGFQMALLPIEKIEISLESDVKSVNLMLTVKGDPAVKSCCVILSAETVETAVGPWLDFWLPALCEANPQIEPECFIVGKTQHMEPRENEFGLKPAISHDPTIMGLGNGTILLLPQKKEIRLDALLAWKLSDGEFFGLYLENSVPCLFVVRGIQADLTSIFSSMAPFLRASSEHDASLVDYVATLGIFWQQEVSGSRCQVVLCKQGDALTLWSDPNRPAFHFSWVLPSRTILASKNGESIVLELAGEQGVKLQSIAKTPSGLVYKTPGEAWALFFTDNAANHPICVTMRSGETAFSPKERYPISAAVDIHVDPAADGLVRVTTKWYQGEKTIEHRHLAPEQQGFAFWEWWDAEKAKVDVANVGTADLYSQYNTARKHNFLLVAFGDILLLNRALESGTPMSALCKKLDEMGGVAFAEDKLLRDETVAKTMLLAASLQDIKQKYEIISSMSPYYWLQGEVKWISHAFGQKAAASIMQSERRRLVPTVRRQVRTIQSDMYRSLGQIESAIRPLESIFAREEIQKHWSSRVRIFLPGIVQVGIGATSLFFDPTGITAIRLLGGAFATVGLGNIFAHFQKDREAAAQIQRAAQGIFPWWQIFMKTLVISIYEAGEFMDAESDVAMKRDRKLIDSIPVEKRSNALKRVNSALRQRIVDERRNRFGEVLAGSGVRVMQIIDDFEQASGQQMKITVDSFVDTLVVTGKRSKLEEQ